MWKRVIALLIVILIASGIVYLLIPKTYEPPPYVAEYSQIRILSDGTFEPSSAPINPDDNIYSLERDIEVEQVIIEKSNIVFDCKNFSFMSMIEKRYKAGRDYRALSLKVTNVENVSLRNIKCTEQGLSVIFENSSSCQITRSKVPVGINNSNNILVSNVTECSINLTNSTYCTISSCSLYTLYPITLDNSDHNIIMNSSLTEPKFIAFRMTNSASNLLFGNIIERTQTLFEITGHSDKNLFVGNYIQGAFYRDPVLNCSGVNTFYHNNLIYVYWNQNSTSTTNIWDNGFEGNYWNDYQGVDSNHDGIGDTPHQVDYNNIDRYPLIQPLDLTIEPQPQLPK